MTGFLPSGSQTITGSLIVGEGEDLQELDLEVTLTSKGARPPVGPAPHLALSFHPWDAYYDNPGPKEKPNALFRDHLDALVRIAHTVPGTLSRVRFDVGWSTSQPKPEPPSLDHYYNRRIMNLLEEFAELGLQGFPVVHQAPGWSHTAAWDDRAKAVTNAENKRFPDDPASIAEWAHWFASTYADHVDEIEFWNEPNLPAFAGYLPGAAKKSAATPDQYVPLLREFAHAARAGNPRVRIIGPNVSQADWTWVLGCYVLGMKPYVDIIGFHAYQGRQSVPPTSIDLTGVARTDTAGQEIPGWEKARLSLGIPAIRETMCQFGDGHKVLWNTESGWSASTTGVGQSGIPDTYTDLDAKAAAFTLEWLNMLTRGVDDQGPEAAYRHIALTTVYQLHDPATTNAHQKGFAVINPDGTLKPQARALHGWRQAVPALRALY